ncbi:MAG TPA: hypothetical protein VE378_05885 [Nitrososphaeraceae archaeon]|jgi:hypothetical protein|nr:hypothetical protein [Nitrososphaeraceae archaeon]
MSSDPSADWILVIVPVATVVIGAGTAIFGIITYWQKKKNELLTQIVMPVLREYNDLEDAEIAIDILNDYPYEFKPIDDPQAYKLYKGQIRKTDLPLVLRDDRWVDTSPVEDKVVKSFDALLYFFAELEYIVQIGLCKSEDLRLFYYEIDKTVEQEAVRNFVNIHRLSFFDGQLRPKLKMEKQSCKIVGNENKQFEKLKEAGYELKKEGY